MLQAVSAVGSNIAEWAQFFGLLGKLKLVLPQMFQDVVRIIAAIFVLYCGIQTKRNFNKYYAAIFLYALAASYLMLFNPRTEGCDYGIVAPAIGIFISLFFACNYQKQMWLSIFIAGGLMMSGAHNFWVAPFFALIFIVIVIKQILEKGNLDENNIASNPVLQ